MRELGGKYIVYAVVNPAPEHLRPIMTSGGEFFQRSGTYVKKIQFSEKRVRSSPKPKITAFLAMSFRDEEEPALADYYGAMKRAVERTKLPIILSRLDLEEGDYEISNEVMKRISESTFVIADFTLEPENVYFELGFARGSSKYVIQTARQGTNLAFDVKSWRTIFYKNATELEERLLPAFVEAYSKVTSQDE